MFTVSVLDSKRKLGPKKQNCLRWDLLPATLIRVSSFDDIHFFFCFRPEIRVLGKFGPRNQDCLFKLKPDTSTNSNILNSLLMLIFSDLDQKNSAWENLVQKTKLVCLS